MVRDRIWAPWRLTYVRTEKPEGCPLCTKPSFEDDAASLVVHRGEKAYVVLNLYPYNPGHLMVLPYRHVGDLELLDDAEAAECQRLITESVRALRASIGPDGFNVGLNLGSAGGAGIADHLHWHVVPRWNGDTNFMPLLGETKVMPMYLEETWRTVRDGFATIATEADHDA